MIFPFTIKYQKHIDVKVSTQNVEPLMNFIEEFITKKNGENVTISAAKLKFSSSIFSGHSWSILGPIEKGEFNIFIENNTYKLSYEFFMFRLFIIVSIMSIFMWLVSKEVEVLLMCFAWLGGMNWFIAIIRHRLMFRKLIIGINNKLAQDKPI